MTGLGRAERFVLGLAVEDYHGLNELLFEDSTAPSEVREAPDRHALMAGVVRQLVDAGLIQVVVYPDPSSWPPVAVPVAEAMSLISDAANWDEPPPDARQVEIGATPLGEELYYSQQRV